MAVLGGGAVSYERGTPAVDVEKALPSRKPPLTRCGYLDSKGT